MLEESGLSLKEDDAHSALSSTRASKIIVNRGASEGSAARVVFTLALVLPSDNVVIAIDGIDDDEGSPRAERSPFGTALALLPPALETHVIATRNADLARHFGALRRQATPCGFIIVDLRVKGDDNLEQLAQSLLAARGADPVMAGLYADAIGATLAARLVEARRSAPAAMRRPCGLLPKWRMRRVVDYIDAHLDETVTLGDLAEAARLTRMHFAAQFRATTGLRPHEFLLRRRVERGKQLLLDQDLSIVEIALTVGFQTQAHFTTVFKRFVGDTPHQWRRAQIAESAPAALPRRYRPAPASTISASLAIA